MITLPEDKIHIGCIIKYLEANGFEFVWVSNVPTTNDDAAAQIIIDAFDYLAEIKKNKVIELKSEGLNRVQSVFPAINDFDELDLVREQWLSITSDARQATTDFQKMIDIVQAGKLAITDINTLTTAANVRAYDVVNTPTWPV